MRVIGYTRVSTEEQAQGGISLDAQAAKVRAYCALYEHDLVDLVVDAGESASSLERPGLQRVLRMLERGEADGLVVTQLDRLTRSLADWLELLKIFAGDGRARLLSVGDYVDTSSPIGRFVLIVRVAVSQLEREMTGDRTRAALSHKKDKGERLGAPAVDDPGVIARVLELDHQGQSLRGICRVLEQDGWPTLKGGPWSPSTVTGLLKRYKGLWAVLAAGGIQALAEALKSPERPVQGANPGSKEASGGEHGESQPNES